MTKREYYSQWVSHIIARSWHVSDTTASIVSLLVPPFTCWAFPVWGTHTADLLWQAPLVLLITLTVTRGVLAPYRIAQEQEQKRAEEIAILQESHHHTEHALRRKIVEMGHTIETPTEQKKKPAPTTTG